MLEFTYHTYDDTKFNKRYILNIRKSLNNLKRREKGLRGREECLRFFSLTYVLVRLLDFWHFSPNSASEHEVMSIQYSELRRQFRKLLSSCQGTRHCVRIRRDYNFYAFIVHQNERSWEREAHKRLSMSAT